MSETNSNPDKANEDDQLPANFIEGLLEDYVSQRVKAIRGLLEVIDFNKWARRINEKYPSEKKLSADDAAPLLSLRLHLQRCLDGLKRFDEVWIREARERMARKAEEQNNDDDDSFGDTLIE